MNDLLMRAMVNFVLPIVGSVITTILTALFAIPYMRRQLQTLEAGQAHAAAAISSLSIAVTQVETARQQCRAEARGTFATAGELGAAENRLRESLGAVRDTIDGLRGHMEESDRRLHGRVDEVHGRVTRLAEEVAAMRPVIDARVQT